MKLIINNLFYKRLFVFNGEKIEKSEKKNFLSEFLFIFRNPT